MDALSYTQVRGNFAKAMNQVCENHAPIIITRQNQKPVVMMSLEDYNSMEETLYLMSSPKNAQRLRTALVNIENKKYIEKKIGDLTE